MNSNCRITAARTRIAMVLAAVFPLAASAEAPSIELNTVVVTGSRVEHNSFDLPAAIDVVDASRIGADQAKVNASEALVAVPGITVQNRQNYAQDLQISSRGFGARSAFGVRGIRLVADGIPASMPDGQGQAATFNLDRAERIEVMRGPMSAIYGNHAGGVIQMFTPDGKGRPTLEAGVSAGSYGTWKADIASQGEVGGMGYVVDASSFGTEGYREHSSVLRNQQMAKLTFAPESVSRLVFVANHFDQPDAQDPLGLDLSQYQSDRRGVNVAAERFNTRKSIEHSQGGVSYERRFGDDLLQLNAFIGRRKVVQFQSITIAAQRNALTTTSGGVIDFDREFGGLGARWIMRRTLAGGGWTTTFGVDHESSQDDRRGYLNYIGTPVSNADTQCTNGTLTCGVRGLLRRKEKDTVTSTDPYIQTELQLANWVLTAGLRHSQVRFKVDDEYLSNGDNGGEVTYRKTTPMAGIAYKLTPAVNLYASVARGFETPTMNELFYSNPATGSFNFSLKPATSIHVEGGVKAFVSASTRLDLAVFEVRTENELVVDQSSGGRTSYKNASRTLRQGYELALDSLLGNGFSTRLALTGVKATYKDSFTTVIGTGATQGTYLIPAGNSLPGIPRTSFFGEIVWRDAPSGFHVGLEAVVRDKVYVDDTNGKQAVTAYTGATDRKAHAAEAYALANLRLGIDRRYGPWALKAYGRIDNLFDKDYVGSVIVGDGNGRFYESAPGRTWLVGASARYAF